MSSVNTDVYSSKHEFSFLKDHLNEEKRNRDMVDKTFYHFQYLIIKIKIYWL